jgi:hypothetical protein
MPQRKKSHVDALAGSPGHFRVDFEYDAIETLDEAKRTLDAYAILEGDYGGQTYVTVPAKLVRCDEQVLRSLLQDLDELGWDNPEGRKLTYWKHKMGEHFGGGMGGAEARDDVWVHERLLELRLEDRIRKVIAGEAPRLGLPADTVHQIRENRRIRSQRVQDSR